MGRMARVVAPGLPHHVTQRGNRRMETFFEEDDSALYLELMAQSVEEKEAAALRRHERTGRPLGNDGFVRSLEERLGRLLHKRKPGPRKPQEGQMTLIK